MRGFRLESRLSTVRDLVDQVLLYRTLWHSHSLTLLVAAMGNAYSLPLDRIPCLPHYRCGCGYVAVDLADIVWHIEHRHSDQAASSEPVDKRRRRSEGSSAAAGHGCCSHRAGHPVRVVREDTGEVVHLPEDNAAADEAAAGSPPPEQTDQQSMQQRLEQMRQGGQLSAEEGDIPYLAEMLSGILQNGEKAAFLGPPGGGACWHRPNTAVVSRA